MPVKLASSLLVSCCFFYACKNPKKLSLEKQVLENPGGVLYVDTFKVAVETIKIDEPSTFKNGHILVGTTKTEIGTVSTSSFAELSFYDFDAFKLGAKSKIDSVTCLAYYEYRIGEGSQNSTFSLYEVTEAIDSLNASPSKQFAYQPDVLATLPLADTGSIISTNSKLLIKRFQQLAKIDSNFTESEFKNAFKGIAFVANGTAEHTIGIRTGTGSQFSINVYYQLDSTVAQTSSNIYTFTISPKSRSSIYVKTQPNTTGAPLFEAIPSSVSTTQTNNLAYLNDLLGIRARVSFPGLSNFLAQIKDKYNLMDVTLEVKSSNAFNQQTKLPNFYLTLMESDPSGNPIKRSNGRYALLQNEQSRSYTQGNLYGDSTDFYLPYNNVETKFSYPLYLYAKEIMNGGKPNNPFILSLASYRTLMSKTPISYSFFDQANQTSGIKLLVYYSKKN